MMSFSTDFDGIGSGSYISINNFNVSTSTYSGSSFNPTYTAGLFNGQAGGGISSPQQYLKERYEQQLREAQERAQAEARRRAEDEKRKKEQEDKQAIENVIKDFNILKQLQGDQSKIQKEAMDIQEVINLQNKFDEIQNEYATMLPTYRSHFSYLLDNIKVPSPPTSLHYHSILLWGFLNTPEDADQAKLDGIKNPFTGENFDDVFAFGTKGWISDSVRVILDHFLSTFNTLSPQTQSHLGVLKGATADEVVCHSNGCRIAEVLIATGQLKVDKLRILGGDGVLGELDYLEKLATEKQMKEISVYAIKGDTIPHSDVFWNIKERMERIGHPLQTFENKRDDPTYQTLGLTDTPRFNPEAKVQVHIFSVPSLQTFVEAHRYTTYDHAIQIRRLSGCMTEEGMMDPRCIIH